MSTNLRKTSRFTVGLLCLVVVGVFVAYGCEKKEKYEDVTYYETIGVGYVFICDSIGWHPASGAEITVKTNLGYSGDGLTPSLPKETFITDKTGRYQIRFIKRTHLRDATLYNISLNGYPCFDIFQFYPDDVINVPNNVCSIPDFRVRCNK